MRGRLKDDSWLARPLRWGGLLRRQRLALQLVGIPRRAGALISTLRQRRGVPAKIDSYSVPNVIRPAPTAA